MIDLANVTVREYLRVSQDRSGIGKSPDQQHDEMERECRARSWRLHPVPYRDDNRSASRYARKTREGFLDLMADLKTGTFGADLLGIWESSRGSRRTSEWLELIDMCMERDVKIPLEFRLLQAADLCDWQGDLDYPEFQELVAQIESRLAQVTAGGVTAGAQKPPAAPRGEARETSARDRPARGASRTAGTDPQRARRRKLAHFVGFILIPSVAICAAAAHLAIRRREPI